MMRKMRIVPEAADAYAAPGLLAQLRALRGFTIADPTTDIRGWWVTGRDWHPLGTVYELIVETSTLEVRYLEVQLTRDVLASAKDAWVLVPAGVARIHEFHDSVTIHPMPAGGLLAAPRSCHEAPTPEQERLIREYFAPAVLSMRYDDEDTLGYARFWQSRPPLNAHLSDIPNGTQQDFTNA